MELMKKRCIVVFPFLFLLLSCTDKEALALFDEVESYIHAEPERALEVLEGVDSSRLVSRRGRARYSLLYTMALDKTWQTPTDESFIRPALEYYRRHGTADDRIKSLYYLGRIQFEGKFYSKAIVSFTRAYSLLDKSSDYRYCGLVNQAIADTYMMTYNDAEVLPYLESAYEWFVKYGDRSLSDLTLCSMAGQYSVLNQYEKADSLFRMAIEAGNIQKESYPLLLSDYALCLIGMSPSTHSQKIEKLFSEAIELSGSLPDYNLWGAYAYILAYNGKHEKSAEIFRQLECHYNDDTSIDFWESRAYAANKDYESAYKSLKRSLFVQDSIINVKLQNSAAQEHSVLERLRFDSALQEREEMLSRLKSEYVSIYRTQFRQLGTLCEAFFASASYRDSHKVVYDKVREMIRDISGDTAGQSRFEEMLNSSLGAVMSHFRDDFPSLDWDDYRFFSYIIVGFDATTISVILRMPSQAAVYAKKSRLKKQISSSSSPYREQYLEFFV